MQTPSVTVQRTPTGDIDIWLRDCQGRITTLTADQARQLGTELLAAAGETSMSTDVAVVSPGPVSTKRGTRLAEDWYPSMSVRNDLIQQYPNLKLLDILVEFRDYWCSVPGQRGLKLSWDRTFRNRVREVAHLPRYQRTNAGRPVSQGPSKVDAKAQSYLED